MNANNRVRWGVGMVTVIAIVALIVYLWRAGLTRAAEISGVGVLIAVIVTPVAAYVFRTGSEGQERAPGMTPSRGRTAVRGSTDPQAPRAGGSSGESSVAHGAQQRSARARGAPLPMEEVISGVVDLLIVAPLSKTESERIAARADIDVSGVSWSAGPRDFWWHVVNRAHTAWTMERLFEAADYVFGDNPRWADAKQDYRAALTAPSAKPLPSADMRVAIVDLAFHERQLKALRGALSLIRPGIFNDRSVRASRLDAARKALLAVDPVIEMVHIAARNADGKPLRRQDLQLLAELLESSRDSVSRGLIALKSVNSEGAALKLCDDVARDSLTRSAHGNSVSLFHGPRR